MERSQERGAPTVEVKEKASRNLSPPFSPFLGCFYAAYLFLFYSKLLLASLTTTAFSFYVWIPIRPILWYTYTSSLLLLTFPLVCMEKRKPGRSVERQRFYQVSRLNKWRWIRSRAIWQNLVLPYLFYLLHNFNFRKINRKSVLSNCSINIVFGSKL